MENDFPTQLVRCVKCNHLSDMHNDKGCFVKEFANQLVHLERCKCEHTTATIQTYIGATSYFIAETERKE